MAAAAAIAVLNNTLYLFTDNYTLTSADGTSWTRYAALAPPDYEPLDAITIFPQDEDPHILLVLGLPWAGMPCP